MIGSTKTFSYVYQGLTLEIVATDLGGGQTSFSITSLIGSADINALYWNDGDAVDDTAGSLGMTNFTGAGSENSLNMNGSGEVWDGGIKLSNTGLGSQGAAKPTFLTQGETLPAFTVNVDWNTLDTIGVRATSTTSPGGSIKGVDDTSVITHPNTPPVAVADKNHGTEDGELVTGSVALNDSDADGDTLTFSLNDEAPAGFTFNPDGSYTLDPSDPAYQSLAEGQVLEIVVPYTVTDEHGATATSALTICLTGTAEQVPNPTVVCHPELLQNWNFEQDIVGPNGFSENPANAPDGWVNLGDPGNAINVHTASFNPFSGYGVGEDQWFDTAKSPGNAHIGQFVNLEEGHTATLSISAAKMAGLYQGTPYATDPNATVDFTFNGEVVLTISVANFLNANEFQTFEVEVTGAAGADTFGIRSAGQELSYGGFAIDHVSLKGTGILFAENFDGYATPENTVNGGPTWVYSSADMTTGGWESASAGANEVAIDGYGGVVPSTSGSHWFDTQGTSGPVNISHDFIDNTAAISGATAVLSFDIAKQNFGSAATDPNASFEVRIDGNVVAQIDAADLANFNEMKHFEVVIQSTDYVAGPNHTIELVDTSPNASNFGFSIDTLEIRDVTICEPAPEPEHGDLKAEWTFEMHTQANGDEVGIPTGFFNLNDWAADHPGFYGEEADAYGFAGSFQVHGVDGARALDTAGSPGNIFIQADPEGRNGAVLSADGGVDGGATMPDLVAGQKYEAEVRILKQDYSTSPDVIEGWEGTDPDAWVEFNFNGTILRVDDEDIDPANEYLTFNVVFEGVEGEDHFSIMSGGVHDDNQGMLIDNVAIYDWA